MPSSKDAGSPNKSVWLFREGNGTLRDLLGGKGAGLSEMTNAGLPVPPGFTITTETCVEYYRNDKHFPVGCWDQVAVALADVEHASARNSVIRSTHSSSRSALARSSPCPG